MEGGGRVLFFAYKKAICKDVSFTLWYPWDYAAGKTLNYWHVTDVDGIFESQVHRNPRRCFS